MIIFLIVLAFMFGSVPAVQAQSDSTPCVGVGCCCNPQAGGNWPDCAPGYECRRQTAPPYIQVCVKKGAPPHTGLQLASGQPAECKKPDSEKEAKQAGPTLGAVPCQGVGCCCNVQGGVHWPDCSPGYECRQMPSPPRVQVCIKKEAPANAQLVVAPGQPPNCGMGGTTAMPGKGHPVCEGQPSQEAREWCYRHFNPRQPPKK